jgi:hypothetical protein
MSALHQIERSGAIPISKTGPTVLDLVRQALAKLQAEPSNHPALIQAMEAVAGSLGLVFGLVQRISSAPPPAQSPSGAPQAVVNAPPVAAAPRVAPMQSVATAPQQAVAPKPAVAPQPAAPAAQPAEAGIDQGTMLSRQTPLAAAHNAPAAAKPSDPKPAGKNSPLATAETMVAASAPVAAAPAAAPQAAAPAAKAVSPFDANGKPLQRVAAELGAHSATNFYKGLGGNDVVDSGGIFVATYQVPEVGKTLLIRVSLPGGYEFEAKGVVRWTREPSPNSRGEDMSPGFGAQFTEISPEARQLVYRYARNREPLFHDDL